MKLQVSKVYILLKEAHSIFSFRMIGHYRRQQVILGRELNFVSLFLREHTARLSVNDNNKKYIHKYFNDWFRVYRLNKGHSIGKSGFNF